MATDDRLRQYSEAGEKFLEGARARASEFLEELTRVGHSSSKQAQGQVDALLDVVRREIAAQLGQLGLATRADLEALERRLGGRAGAETSAPSTRASAARTARSAARPSAPATPRPRKAAGPAAPTTAAATKAASTKAAATKAASSTKGAPAKAAGAKRSATKAGAPKKAATTRAPVKKAGGPTAS